MNRSESIGKLVEALNAARKTIKPIQKGKKAEIATKAGGKFSYSYADLADVLESVSAPLAANGLAIIQTTRVNGGFQLVTTLAHSSGEWIEGEMPLPGEDGDARSLGSWLTYLRRYAVCSILSIAAEDDDDGERAAPRTRTAPQPANDALKPLRQEVYDKASELEQRIGQSIEAHVKAASQFPGKDGKPRFFVDPFDPSLGSEKWLKTTLSKLVRELEKTEPGAEGAGDEFKASDDDVAFLR
jgi:hypothetical protein